MKNPPDFVMYVVMVKPPGHDKFSPCWGDWADSLPGVHAMGFARKPDADKECRIFRTRYGKKNGLRAAIRPIFVSAGPGN